MCDVEDDVAAVLLINNVVKRSNMKRIIVLAICRVGGEEASIIYEVINIRCY